jgi:PBP1b-binding outer membrane lipoprotein LpoB
MATGKLSDISGDNSGEVVSPDVVPQDFLNITGKMSENLIKCDAIAKASKSPLIVVHMINNASNRPFNTKNYTEALRNLLINRWQAKARFIDKETSEKADYFLVGTISDVGSSEGNGSSGSYPSDSEFAGLICNFDTVAEVKESAGEGNVILKPYNFSMRLTNADSGAIVWEDTQEFKRKEMGSNPRRYKKFRGK